MTKNEENKFSMYRAVYSVLNENQTEVATIPALESAKTNFNTLMTSINEKDNAYKTSTAGKTDAKKNVKETLLDVLVPCTNSLFAYASKAKIADLKANTNVSISKFRQMRDNDFINKARSIHDLLNSNVASLADYGITAAKVTELNEKLNDYADAIGNKDASYASKSAARQTLSQLFDQADVVLKNEIDSLMESFKTANEIFYNKYWSARVIKDLGLGHNDKPTPPPTPNP